MTTKRNLERLLARIDAREAGAREAIISAIEQLTREYIVPAMRRCALDADGLGVFDLDEIAGTEIHNLMLSLFESKMDGLNKPGDDALAEALVASGIGNLSAEKRNDFYRVWAGEKAVEAISRLAQSLSAKPAAPEDFSALESEEARLVELLRLDLPATVKTHLTMVLSSRQAAL